MSRTLRVALFPLPGAILFPRSQLPLHIFEARYREMVRDAIEGPGRIAMIQPHRLDDDNRAPLYGVGCIGELVSVEELDDGRYNIVLLGSNRFRVLRERRLLGAQRTPIDRYEGLVATRGMLLFQLQVNAEFIVPSEPLLLGNSVEKPPGIRPAEAFLYVANKE